MWLSVTFLAVLLTGCGGSSSDNSSSGGGGDSGGGNNGGVAKTGYFLDSAVQGINFKTATKSGLTDSKGAFPYNEGEEVTFSIGELVFPTATAIQYITPLELADTTDSQDPQVVNIVRLLMTLDTDGDPNNGITISSDAKYVAPAGLNFDQSTEEFSTSPEVIDFISNAGQTTPVTTLISAEEATAHITETLKDIENLDTYKEVIGMFTLDANTDDIGTYNGILNIYSDGSYLMVEYYHTGDSDMDEDSGIEYGDLNLQKDGSLDPIIKEDTNSVEYGGLSSGTFTNVHMDGNNLHMTKTETNCEGDTPDNCSYTVVAPREDMGGNTIEGSWEGQTEGTNAASDGGTGTVIYNFRSDGKYFLAQVADSDKKIGAEVGNYTYEPASGTLTLTNEYDSSGSRLLADNGKAYTINSVILSTDGQTLTIDYLADKNQPVTLELIRKF